MNQSLESPRSWFIQKVIKYIETVESPSAPFFAAKEDDVTDGVSSRLCSFSIIFLSCADRFDPTRGSAGHAADSVSPRVPRLRPAE